MRSLLTLMMLCVLGGCSTQTEFVVVDPEPRYSVEDGYVTVVSPASIIVEDGHGKIGTIDPRGLKLIHKRHLKALVDAASR